MLEGEPIIDSWGSLIVKGIYSEELDCHKDYTIIAKEIYDEQRGTQYELMFIGESLDLSKVKNQRGFLKSFLTDGQVDEMFKVLSNPLEAIENHDIAALKRVKGVGDYIANCIIERFEKNKDDCEVYIELDNFGLTPNFIQKLIQRYKNPHKVIEIVKQNPYQLSFDVDGIGFKTADDIAIKGGIQRKSPERIKGYINYILDNLGQSGNSYITSGELTSYIFEEFGGRDNILDIYQDKNGCIIGNNINDAINSLKEENIIIVEDHEEKSQRRVYLKKYYDLEKEISEHLKRIANTENKFNYENWEEIVRQQEHKQGYQFTDEQIAGIKTGLDNQVCFITGGAGVGKSSLVSGILESLKDYTFAQTALAGKASARLQEVTGEEGFTIHRLLGFNPSLGFTFNEDNPLEYDIIILDEISLVGGEIFLSLLKAIPNGSKLIILGDMGQLESIGCMNLAFDLYKSKSIVTIELTKVHRQAQKSGIITTSQQIRKGQPVLEKKYTGIKTFGELQDMHFDIEDSCNTNKKTITVTPDMVNSLASFRCTVGYNGRNYIAYWTVTDKNDPVELLVMSTVGSQLTKDADFGIIYVLAYLNGKEIDAIKSTVFSTTSPSGQTGDFYYHVDKVAKKVILKKHNGTGWIDATGEDLPKGTYKYFRRNSEGVELDKAGIPWNTGKAVFVDRTIIDGSTAFMCEADIPLA